MSQNNENNTMMIPASAEVVDISATDHVFKNPSALFIGTGGDVAVILSNDSVAVTFRNIADGTWLAINAKTVVKTGTTAAYIVGAH